MSDEYRRGVYDAAQLAEDAIANNVTVLSAAEVADAIRNLAPRAPVPRKSNWLVKAWRRVRGCCPSCGGELQEVIVPTVAMLGDACRACGWWRDYGPDGTRFEHWLVRNQPAPRSGT